MRYLALATDYDGTLAQKGRVPASTVAALEKLRGTGRKLILVTGRELEELLAIFPELHLFERVVAENGALLYEPATRATRVLAEGPPSGFVAALKRRGVGPIAVGHAIVATWKPHEMAVLETIRDQALELQVIFNKDAVMVLPAGVTKASGLAAALAELELSPHEVVSIGDAENDHALLAMSAFGVAVDNALPAVKSRADLVTPADHGKGVEQLIDLLLNDDLQQFDPKLTRHALLLGHNADGSEVYVPARSGNLLIAGPSGSGKSTSAKSFLERLEERHYQFCIIDPEGDYDGLEGAITIGSGKQAPTVEEVLQLLRKPDTNVVANLLGLDLADRPPFFLGLLPRLQEMRGRTGRPHWIIVDETHHLLPAAWQPGLAALPQQLDRMVFVTVHPEQIMPAALQAVSSVIAVGRDPQATISNYCNAVGDNLKPEIPQVSSTADAEQVIYWPRQAQRAPMRLRMVLPTKEHQRHIRKYAEGELAPENCFYFRGPEGKLNLRVQNLVAFNQIAAGVDEGTWLYHLERGDFSRWFREKIHDNLLADEATKIEATPKPVAAETRERMRKLIEQHYTLPASAPIPLPGTTAESIVPAT